MFTDPSLRNRPREDAGKALESLLALLENGASVVVRYVSSSSVRLKFHISDFPDPSTKVIKNDQNVFLCDVNV